MSRTSDCPARFGFTFFAIPGVLKLPAARRIIDPEIHSVPVAQLRIIRSRARHKRPDDKLGLLWAMRTSRNGRSSLILIFSGLSYPHGRCEVSRGWSRRCTVSDSRRMDRPAEFSIHHPPGGRRHAFAQPAGRQASQECRGSRPKDDAEILRAKCSYRGAFGTPLPSGSRI